MGWKATRQSVERKRDAFRRMAVTLSKADVERLLSDPSDEARADVAAKVARHTGSGALTPQQQSLAEDILRALARDVAVCVRQALAEELKESPRLPHDLALALARDVEAVSLPILHHSVVLTDADLIALIRASGVDKQAAIAGRKQVSPAVAEAIVEAGQAVAVAALVGNDGAELTQPTLQRVLDRYGASDAVKGPMARRTSLPTAVLERLVAAASAELRDVLAKRKDLPERLASDLVLETRDLATSGLMSPPSAEGEALALAQQLHGAGRLTPPLIVRAICLGDLAFVEAAFAVLADIPLHNARLLIYDAGALGFKAIYERCRLPTKFLELFRIGLRVAQQTPFDGGANDRERHSRRTLERILTQYDNISADDLEYLLGKLRSGSGVAA
jgi:uncharacterized protein (DUF2336 family)